MEKLACQKHGSIFTCELHKTNNQPEYCPWNKIVDFNIFTIFLFFFVEEYTAEGEFTKWNMQGDKRRKHKSS